MCALPFLTSVFRTVASPTMATQMVIFVTLLVLTIFSSGFANPIQTKPKAIDDETQLHSISDRLSSVNDGEDSSPSVPPATAESDYSDDSEVSTPLDGDEVLVKPTRPRCQNGSLECHHSDHRLYRCIDGYTYEATGETCNRSCTRGYEEIKHGCYYYVRFNKRGEPSRSPSKTCDFERYQCNPKHARPARLCIKYECDNGKLVYPRQW